MRTLFQASLLAAIASPALAAPVQPSTLVEVRTGQISMGTRVGVEGVVTATSPGRVVLQKGHDAGLTVLTGTGHGLQAGQQVRLSGTLRRDHGLSVLRMGPRDRILLTGTAAVPSPIAVSWQELEDPSRLLELESMVVQLEPAGWTAPNVPRAATPFALESLADPSDRLLVWNLLHPATASSTDLWTAPVGVLLRYEHVPLLAPRSAADLAPSDCDASTALALPGTVELTDVSAYIDQHWGSPVGCDYNESRESIYFDLHYVHGEVEGVYTGERIAVSLGALPHHTVFNTEHTWPQSWGADTNPMRCDLHHLFPVEAGVNSRRSNHPLDMVTTAVWSDGGALLGDNALGERVFEPRDSHKGNAARAILYYIAQYDEFLEPELIALYQDWSALDPVDDAERARNAAIEALQGVSNPFITCPGLVERLP